MFSPALFSNHFVNIICDLVWHYISVMSVQTFTWSSFKNSFQINYCDILLTSLQSCSHRSIPVIVWSHLKRLTNQFMLIIICILPCLASYKLSQWGSQWEIASCHFFTQLLIIYRFIVPGKILSASWLTWNSHLFPLWPCEYLP